MDLKHRDSHLLLGNWRELHSQGGLASKYDLDADMLSHLLPNILVIDYQASDRLIVRLAGQDVRSRFGAVASDWNFLNSFAVSNQAQLSAAIADVVKRRHPLKLRLLALMKSGCWAEFEAIFLPSSSCDRATSQLIGIHLPVSVSDEGDSIQEQYVIELDFMAFDPRASEARDARVNGGTKKGLRLVSSNG